MTKLLVTYVTLFVVFASYITNVSNANTHKWAKTQHYYGQDTKTILQFYFHDNQTGGSPTVATIARPIEPAFTSVSGFGNLFMVDDPLTVSPDPSSKLVGRAQGFYGSASKESVTYITGLTFGFVNGVYNGSSIVIFGPNLIVNPVRELPVVGGTGFFRMARGYAVARTYYHNSTSHNAIVGYNVTIFHP